VPCWADLQTPDVRGIEPFYASVLGWTFLNDDDNQFGGYAIAQAQDVAAAGIGPQASAEIPPAWTLYFASDDADKTAAAITENGGQVVAPVFDVGPLGRMCIAVDPTGASFGLWQAREHIGANITNEPGGIVWEDLRSPDPAAAQAFYRSVFGFETHPLEMAGSDYQTFHPPGDEAPLGGIGGMMGADDAPPHWLVYFAVADARAAAAAAQSAGGTVVAEPFDTPYGIMAGLLDPAGALFYVVEAAPDQPRPERSS
jgi:hypothetical protein